MFYYSYRITPRERINYKYEQDTTLILAFAGDWRYIICFITLLLQVMKAKY